MPSKINWLQRTSTGVPKAVIERQELVVVFGRPVGGRELFLMSSFTLEDDQFSLNDWR